MAQVGYVVWVYVIVRQGGPAGVKDEKKFNFLPAPSFFTKEKNRIKTDDGA